MAHAPEIKLPVKADVTSVVAVIDVIVKHLAALREELAAMGDERKGVRYWVTMADELLADREAAEGFTQAGLRVVEVGGRHGAHSRQVLIEDEGASPELEGRQVELTLTYEVHGGVPAVRVSERRVIG